MHQLSIYSPAFLFSVVFYLFFYKPQFLLCLIWLISLFNNMVHFIGMLFTETDSFVLFVYFSSFQWLSLAIKYQFNGVLSLNFDTNMSLPFTTTTNNFTSHHNLIFNWLKLLSILPNSKNISPILTYFQD